MLLAIDTAGPWVSICAGLQDEPGECVRRATRLNHNETLSSLLAEVISRLGAPCFEAVAVDVGPGSFTGTRVGVAFALGLAEGWGVPVVPVSVFAVAAELAPADSREVVVAFPIVRDSWCRAYLTRTDEGWLEESVQEVTRAEAAVCREDVPLIVLWGELAEGTSPPGEWNPARHVLQCAARELAAGKLEGEPVQVRYLGPSQAERNYRARNHRNSRSHD